MINDKDNNGDATINNNNITINEKIITITKNNSNNNDSSI